MAHAKSAKSAKGTGGMREERGRGASMENHENRFADIERREGCGWSVDNEKTAGGCTIW